MLGMHQRSDEQELIDLGPSSYSQAEYHDCMRQLGRVGRLLGGDRATLAAFDQLKERPTSILDVGCGGGDTARLLAKRYPMCRVEGIDFSQEAVRVAASHPDNTLFPHLSFHKPQTLELSCEPKSYDVVTATLVCHHMSDAQLVDFLKRASTAAKKAIIINDLHRHPLAYTSYGLIAPVLFGNRLITHDGLISIKRGFTKQDWIRYLGEAGFNQKQWSIHWKWAFRWTILIHL